MVETVTHNKEDVFRNSYARDTGTEEADELVKLLNKVTDIYCENDFLIKKNRVEILVLQHQHLIITRNIIEEKSKKVNIQEVILSICIKIVFSMWGVSISPTMATRASWVSRTSWSRSPRRGWR